MRLTVQSGNRDLEVEVSASGGKCAIVGAGGQCTADCARVSNHHYSILLEGRVYDLLVEPDGETCVVEGRQGSREFRFRDPRRLDEEKAVDSGRAGLQRICAEMPGKIVRVMVRVGDAVGFNQALLVVEAMKMQNEIRAPKAGVVKEVDAREGGTVTSGAFLLSIE